MYLVPTKVHEFYINDVFYNDVGDLVIIVQGHRPPLDIKYFDVMNSIILPFNRHTCSHKHCSIFYLKQIPHYPTANLIINKKMINVIVNTYPTFADEIIFSTLVKNEDDYIIPWINFHLKLGITRFIIYDNSNKNNLKEILKNFIHKKIVFLLRWSYDYEGECAQQTQQNHSIYAFQTCKYIGLFDIDEYVNIQLKDNTKIDKLFTNIVNDTTKISGFQLLNKFFYNPNNLPTKNGEFLKIIDCDHIQLSGREKCFVIPKHVKSFSVHLVTDGLPLFKISEKYAFFNHYSFLNKSYRGRNKTGMVDDSLLRKYFNMNII